VIRHRWSESIPSSIIHTVGAGGCGQKCAMFCLKRQLLCLFYPTPVETERITGLYTCYVLTLMYEERKIYDLGQKLCYRWRDADVRSVERNVVQTGGTAVIYLTYTCGQTIAISVLYIHHEKRSNGPLSFNKEILELATKLSRTSG
jgi:hypothetical protein